MTQKRCSGCKQEKDAVEFYKNSSRPDGLGSYCISCGRNMAAERRISKPESYKAASARYSKKNKEKQSARNKAYYAADREGQKRRAQAWRDANKDRAKATTKAWRQLNKVRHLEALKAWRRRNKRRLREQRKVAYELKGDAERAGARRWKRRNPAVVNALNAKRIAAKLRAIPSWADLSRIEDFYRGARELTAQTGIVHHVDHVIPLVSPYVCGLHCEANLEVLTGPANQSKSNRQWPDMPEALLTDDPATSGLA